MSATRMLDGAEATSMVEDIVARGTMRRILCVAGPGDVVGSYGYWLRNEDDPRITAVSYSQQLFELADRLDAILWVVTQHALPSDLPEGRVRFVYLPAPTGRGLGYNLSDLRYALKVLALARRHRVDTLIVQRMLRNFWPLAFFPGSGRRLFFSLHNALSGEGPLSAAERFYFAGKRRALKASQGILAVGPLLAQQVEAQIGHARAVHAHVPQYSEATVSIGDTPVERRAKRVIYAGRIEDNKGVFDLLNAFEAIAPEHPDATLMYLGRGGALAELQSRASSSQFAASIEVLGPLPGREVIERIASSAILVCATSSRFPEGLAKTPLEAALNEVPCIMTNVVPAKDMLGDGGVIIPPDNPQRLAEALGDLLSDPERLERMGMAAREAVKSNVTDPSKSFGATLLRILEQASRSDTAG